MSFMLRVFPKRFPREFLLLPLQDVAEPLQDLKDGIKELKTNKTFRIVLSVLRSIGNLLNNTKVSNAYD